MISILVMVLIGLLCTYWYHKNRDLYQLDITEKKYFKYEYPIIDVLFKHLYLVIQLGLSSSEGLWKLIIDLW